MVDRIRVVIRHALTAQVVIRALHPTGNLLCAAVVLAVVEGLSTIVLLLARCGQGATQHGQRYKCNPGKTHVLTSGTIQGTDSNMNLAKRGHGSAVTEEAGARRNRIRCRSGQRGT